MLLAVPHFPIENLPLRHYAKYLADAYIGANDLSTQVAALNGLVAIRIHEETKAAAAAAAANRPGGTPG